MMERDLYAPAQTSVWNWNTGQPSIFGGLQVNVGKAPVRLEIRPDPVRLPKKPRKQREATGKTRPLHVRVDFEAVREYRLSGKTWVEVAVRFECCMKSIHDHATRLYPELKRTHCTEGKARGKKPMPLPLEDTATSMLAGESLRGAAKRLGIAHPTLRHRLMQIPAGVQAVQAAKYRAEASNAAKKEAAEKRPRLFASVPTRFSQPITTRAQADKTNSIKGKL
jgi:hypothetical protein